MSDTLSIDIQALGALLLEDYFRFFDGDAFADNPHWAACYCHHAHAPQDGRPWQDWTAAENRAEVGRRIAEGRMHGYLAFSGGRPVAWCNAGPRRELTVVPREEGEEAVGAVACFLVAKPFRGRGVARLLLRAACEGFRLSGMAFAEGYPRPCASGEADNYHGPLSLFLSEGFEPVGEWNGATVVRKRL
jgi:GNAT superfamily N-acetyltransferase